VEVDVLDADAMHGGFGSGERAQHPRGSTLHAVRQVGSGQEVQQVLQMAEGLVPRQGKRDLGGGDALAFDTFGE